MSDSPPLSFARSIYALVSFYAFFHKQIGNAFRCFLFACFGMLWDSKGGLGIPPAHFICFCQKAQVSPPSLFLHVLPSNIRQPSPNLSLHPFSDHRGDSIAFSRRCKKPLMPPEIARPRPLPRRLTALVFAAIIKSTPRRFQDRRTFVIRRKVVTAFFAGSAGDTASAPEQAATEVSP